MSAGTGASLPIKMKSVFEYSDYRSYLRDFYEHAKVTRRSFSYRLFSRLCGFKSPNFLQLVMNGKSALSSVSVENVIRGLKLNKEESEFFRNLVGFNDAKKSDKKAHFARLLMKSKTYRRTFQLTEAQYRYLGIWYYPVIRSAIGLDCFPGDLGWIAENIRPRLTLDQVTKAVDEMIQLGLLQKDPKGRLSQCEKMVGTPSEIASSFAADYHRQMLALAGESIDRFKREERHLVGMTIALDPKMLAKAKDLAEQFRNDIMDLASQSESSTAIYQVGFQVFPLMTPAKDEQ